MWPCFGIIVTLLSSLVLNAFAKRIVLNDDELSDLNNMSSDPAATATKVQGIRVGNLQQLNKLVQEVRSGIRLIKPLGKGGFGIAFDATFSSPAVPKPQRCVVKFTAMNSKEAKNWAEIEVATAQHEDFRNHLNDMRDECYLMQRMKVTTTGKLAIAADTAGAGALSECILNCHDEIGPRREVAPNACRTLGTQPPFIVLTYAGDNGAQWVKPKSGAARSPAEIDTVLNQVREGIRFMSEIHHDLKCKIDDPDSSPIVHHDLKWANVCVRSVENLRGEGQSVSNWRANLIDFGAAVDFVYHTNRTYKPTVGTIGYAPPEWYIGKPYDDPPWSFDIYSLGAMALWAVCDVDKQHIITHGKELAKLLRCNREALKESLPSADRSSSSPRRSAGAAPDCSLSKETLDAALAEINFAKPLKDYDRFKDDMSFHSRFCERAIPKTEHTKREICKSIELLMHPNPMLRPKPSSFKFDTLLGGVVAETWKLAQQFPSAEPLPDRGSSLGIRSSVAWTIPWDSKK